MVFIVKVACIHLTNEKSISSSSLNFFLRPVFNLLSLNGNAFFTALGRMSIREIRNSLGCNGLLDEMVNLLYKLLKSEQTVTL